MERGSRVWKRKGGFFCQGRLILLIGPYLHQDNHGVKDIEKNVDVVKWFHVLHDPSIHHTSLCH